MPRPTTKPPLSVSPSSVATGEGRVRAVLPNVCYAAWGPGPADRRCGECQNLYIARKGSDARGTQVGGVPADQLNARVPTEYRCLYAEGQPWRVTAPACGRFTEPTPIHRDSRFLEPSWPGQRIPSPQRPIPSPLASRWIGAPRASGTGEG